MHFNSMQAVASELFPINDQENVCDTILGGVRD